MYCRASVCDHPGRVRKAVLADTSLLYCALDPSDDNHYRAQEGIERLNAEGIGIMVAYTPLCECYSLILHKLGIGVRLAEGRKRPCLPGEPHPRRFRGGCRPGSCAPGSGVEHVRRRDSLVEPVARAAGLDVRSPLRRRSGRGVARWVASAEFNVNLHFFVVRWRGNIDNGLLLRRSASGEREDFGGGAARGGRSSPVHRGEIVTTLCEILVYYVPVT